MVQNSGNTIPEGMDNTRPLGALSDVSKLVGQGAQRVALITSLGLGMLASDARAEEVRVADAGPSVEGTVARAFDGLPTTVEEMNESLERQRIISKVAAQRQNGAEYYGPYVAEFNALSEQSQYEIALLIYSENSQGGPDYSQDTIDLVRNLRLPESLIQAILEEAEVNGAHPRLQIRGFLATLNNFRESGEVSESLGLVFNKAPVEASKIFFVLVSQTSIDNNNDAQRRLVDVQGRLVDAQGRLIQGQEIIDKGNNILGE